MTFPSPGAGAAESSPEDSVAWEQWLSGWETYLSDMVAWCAAPTDLVPDPPTTAQPAPPAPAALTVRLERCAALRRQLIRDLGDQLAASRPWTPPADPGTATGSRVALDL